jgi:hypothetical protein
MAHLRCDDCGARFYTAATDHATVRRFCEHGCTAWVEEEQAMCGGSVSSDLDPPPWGAAAAAAPEPRIPPVLSKTAAHSQAAEPPEQKHRYIDRSEAA